MQVYEPAHQYAFKSKTREVLHNVHKMIRLRLLACAKALIEHQAPDGSDWESQQQMLLTGVEAMCQVLYRLTTIMLSVVIRSMQATQGGCRVLHIYAEPLSCLRKRSGLVCTIPSVHTG